MSNCRSCHARIRWAVTKAGKAMPLDFDVNPEGNVVFTGRTAKLRQGGTAPVVEVVGQPMLLEDDRPRYMPHHATCPEAGKWKR